MVAEIFPTDSSAVVGVCFPLFPGEKGNKEQLLVAESHLSLRLWGMGGGDPPSELLFCCDPSQVKVRPVHWGTQCQPQSPHPQKVHQGFIRPQIPETSF